MYDIVYTDPPWEQAKGNARKCRPKQGKALDYKTMSISEIEEYHNGFLNTHTAQKHCVFMWTIDKYLYDAEAMMKRIGYSLHARIVWDKKNGVAPAFTIRFAHEYLLWFYVKGLMLKPEKEVRGKYTTVISESSTKHSVKPEAAYCMIENMFPSARKVELFARNGRQGWTSVGDEVCSRGVEGEG